MDFRKQKEITGHASAVYTCVSDGIFIYSGSSDKFVTRWLKEEGIQDKFAIRFEQSVYALDLINGNVLAVGLADGSLYFFELESRKELHYFTQHTVGIFSIKYNSKEQQIYVGDADGNLSIWSDQFKLLVYLPLNCGKIRSIALSPDRSRFALACQDGTIRIFETEFFNEIKTFDAHENGATSVLFDPLNGNRLISGGKDALLKDWNIDTGKCINTVVAHTFAIYDIVSIMNGQFLVTASRDKNVKIWNSKDLEFVKRMDVKEGGHRHSVNALAKIDERMVVSCSDDKRLIIWELINSYK